MIKLSNKTWLLFTLLIFLSVSADAQQSVEQEQRQRDEEAVQSMEDPGFDFAVVTALQATIIEDSTPASRVLLRVERGEMLALVDRDPVNTFYRVIEVKTGTEGWINQRNVIVKYTKKISSGPSLQAERVSSTGNPEIEISNDSHKSLSIRVAGSLYTVAPNTKQVITVKPGQYKFYAYAPGVQPAIGQHDFAVGMKYTWSFWIETR